MQGETPLVSRTLCTGNAHVSLWVGSCRGEQYLVLLGHEVRRDVEGEREELVPARARSVPRMLYGARRLVPPLPPPYTVSVRVALLYCDPRISHNLCRLSTARGGS
eukprot:2307290-Rhodomonas_salina.1